MSPNYNRHFIAYLTNYKCVQQKVFDYFRSDKEIITACMRNTRC